MKPDIKIFSSYYFLPIHLSGLEYKGHGKIYAYQEWGSTKDNYRDMNTIATLMFYDSSINKSININTIL